MKKPISTMATTIVVNRTGPLPWCGNGETCSFDSVQPESAGVVFLGEDGSSWPAWALIMYRNGTQQKIKMGTIFLCYIYITQSRTVTTPQVQGPLAVTSKAVPDHSASALVSIYLIDHEKVRFGSYSTRICTCETFIVDSVTVLRVT